MGRLLLRLGIGAGLLIAAAFIAWLVVHQGEPLVTRVGVFFGCLTWALAGALVLGLHRVVRGLHEQVLAASLFFIGVGVMASLALLGDGDGRAGSHFAAAGMLVFSVMGVMGLLRAREIPTWNLEATAKAIGIPLVPRSIWCAPTARGVVRGIEMTLVTTELDESIEATSPDIPTDVVIDRERLVELTSETLVTGDEEFDEMVFARGDPANLLARLDPTARKRIRDAVAEAVTVRGGRVRWSWESPAARKQSFAVVAPLVLAAAEAIARPGSMTERLQDPVPGVRMRALELLARIEHWTTALSDPHPIVRRRAAEHLLADPHCPPDTRARADETVRALAGGSVSLADGSRGALSTPAAQGAVTISRKR